MPTSFRTCPLCEATCGLEITVEDGQVARIRGDRADVFSRGFICPKGSTLGELHEDPDRLHQPQLRRGDTWISVTWDEAFAEIERRLLPIREKHGPNSIGIYLGNPNVHGLAGTLYVRPLVKALGTRNVFSASTVDQMPKHVSSGLMFGHPLTIPVPDIDRTDYLLMMVPTPRPRTAAWRRRRIGRDGWRRSAGAGDASLWSTRAARSRRRWQTSICSSAPVRMPPGSAPW
jgi:anaerobic selenocysteine-containing dehydrogenase